MAPGTPCLMFAVRRESMFFRRDCRALTRVPSAPCSAFLAGPPLSPLLVVETGIGRAAVETALDWAFAGPAPPSFVLYAGFAGALDPGLHVGDVLLADTVLDEAGRPWPATWPPPSAPLPPSLRRGRLLTAAQLVAVPEEKCRLRALHQAHAVDMEAAHVAARCATHQVPFGCLRAISDAVGTPLSPALVALLSAGRVSFPRVFAALLGQPTLLTEFWRLARDTRLAALELSTALRLLINDCTAESDSA